MRIEWLLTKQRALGGFQRLGYHVQSYDKCRPVDLRDSCEHPLVLSYRHPGRVLLLEAPLDFGRGRFGYPSQHAAPLFDALERVYQDSNDVELMIAQALERFYAAWQPVSAATYFGLSPSDCPSLANLPAWHSLLPWEALSLEQKRVQRLRVEERESARIRGLSLPIEHGWKYCGPASTAKVGVEAKRFSRLITSVQRHGTLRHDGPDGDIRAVVMLREDGAWRWLVEAGQHRFAVFAALKRSRIPVRLERIVRREEVAFFPGVVSGLFSESAALRVFDNFFEGHPLPEVQCHAMKA